MLYGLTSVLSAVIYNAVAVRKSHKLRDLRNSLENACDLNAVISGDHIGTANMRFRHYKNVNGRLGIYILERVNVFILIYLRRGDLTRDNFTKQTIHNFTSLFYRYDNYSR